jgi:MYXO-CTERM domain-containing protein
MNKLLITLGTTCLLTFAGPAIVHAQTTPSATPGTTAQVENDDDGDDDFDMGWLGLLGLIGLAGLRRRHAHDTTTTTVRR